MMLTGVFIETTEPCFTFSSSQEFFEFYECCLTRQLYVEFDARFRSTVKGRLFSIIVSRWRVLMNTQAIQTSGRIWCLDQYPAADIVWWRFIYNGMKHESITKSVQAFRNAFSQDKVKQSF
jgi:hypothetical protein